MAIEGPLKAYAERAEILLAQAEKAHAAALKMGEIEDKGIRSWRSAAAGFTNG